MNLDVVRCLVAFWNCEVSVPPNCFVMTHLKFKRFRVGIHKGITIYLDEMLVSVAQDDMVVGIRDGDQLHKPRYCKDQQLKQL